MNNEAVSELQVHSGNWRAAAEKNQEDNRRSQNAFEKGALKRIADKEAIRQDLMRKKGIEHIKKMEETRLHTVDIEQNQQFNRERKQQQQDFNLKNEYHKGAFNTEVSYQFDKLLSDTKKRSNSIERHSTDINPRMIISWKRPDALFTEVRSRKLKELSEYSSKPADDRARDIMHLLTAMKDKKKG